MQTDNPMGTDGFEFVEFTAPDPAALGEVFERLGFKLVDFRCQNKIRFGQAIYRVGPRRDLDFAPA